MRSEFDYFDLLVLSDMSFITAYLLYTYAVNAKTHIGRQHRYIGVIFCGLDHSCLGAICGICGRWWGL